MQGYNWIFILIQYIFPLVFRHYSANHALSRSTRQVMKTYHMYNADSINAESKLKEAEKQEEKQMGRGARQEERQTPRSPDTLASVRLDDKPVRRSSVKKIEKMKEKVRTEEKGWNEASCGERVRVTDLFWSSVVSWNERTYCVWM